MNQSIFTGRITSAPTFKANKDGSQTVLFQLAVRRNYANHEGVVESDFINLQGYIPANKVGTKHQYSYLDTGMLVSVTAEIRTYTIGEGDARTYGWNLQANNIEFLESKAVTDARKAARAAQAQQAPAAVAVPA